ncbi:MAG: SIS domain-containing protein [Planctomycetes bacterium]|nr:SIS domain-containing protein [Planctomycetota bacterium]
MAADPDYLLEEMLEQPGVFARILAEAGAAAEATASGAPPARVVLTGCGDSFCAAQSGVWAMRAGARAWGGWTGDALAVRPLELARARSELLGPATWVVAISASGRTPRVLEAVSAARAAGSRAIALTDDPTGPLARAADHALPLLASPPEALGSTDYADPQARRYVGYHHDVPQTKTVTASILHAVLLAAALAPASAPRWREALHRFPAAAERALADTAAPAGEAARAMAAAGVLVFTGSGPAYPVAQYGAFKAYEFARVGLWQETEEYCHTQYFITGRGTPVVFLAPDRLARERAAEIAPVLADRLGACGILVTGECADAAGCAHVLRVPDTAPPPLVPLLLYLAVQRLMHAFARAAGLSTSTFRGGLDPERYVAGSCDTIRASRIVPPGELGIPGA